MITKICKGSCGLEKSIEEFHKQKAGKYGRTSRCKTCVSLYQAEWYSKNRDEQIELHAEWRAANPTYQSEYWSRNSDVTHVDPDE